MFKACIYGWCPLEQAKSPRLPHCRGLHSLCCTMLWWWLATRLVDGAQLHPAPMTREVRQTSKGVARSTRPTGSKWCRSWTTGCDGRYCQQALPRLTGRSNSSKLKCATWSSPGGKPNDRPSRSPPVGAILDHPKHWGVPSGNRNRGTIEIVDFPIQNGDVPYLC